MLPKSRKSSKNSENWGITMNKIDIYKPKSLSVRQFFSQHDSKYIIPPYQRNYAWEEQEITELLRDIIDYAYINNHNSYYIGTIILFEREKRGESGEILFETIDGQQRITTLNILLSVLKHFANEGPIYKNEIPDMNWYELNLIFDSRINSTDTMNDLFEYGEITDPSKCNIAIKAGFDIIKQHLLSIIKEKNFTSPVSLNSFCNYLFDKVEVLQVLVPKGTDLNHYFEIMNSRGEQLEKHEILKSRFLEKLTDKKQQYVFNVLWEACSNIEKYVQYGFHSSIRKKIFGDGLNTIIHNNFESIVYIFPDSDAVLQTQSLQDIINGMIYDNGNQDREKNDFNSERFHSVINFPNLLLHVLRVMTGKDIALDDKQLLDQFNNYFNEQFAKEFIYNLLKAKFLTDKYVIKREYLQDKESWSLKSIKRFQGNNINYTNTFGSDDDENGDNKEIIMLLSMFHVSIPSQNYKHWFSAVLNYLLKNETNVDPINYKFFLENLAKSYLYDNYLSVPVNKKDYYTIIFKNNCMPINTISEIDLHLLNKGTSVENFIFNLLDYLLWKNKCISDNSFEFSFRSSVEHFYPQHPANGEKLTEINGFGEEYINSFGNLCLLSSNKNSRFTNNLPLAKVANFADTTHESLKLKLMMGITKENQQWRVDEIAAHGNDMEHLLLTI